MIVNQTSRGTSGFRGTGRCSSRTGTVDASAATARQKRAAAVLCFLERDLPATRIPREYCSRGRTPDTLAACAPDDEELGDQRGFRYQAPDERETGRVCSKPEGVARSIRIRLAADMG